MNDATLNYFRDLADALAGDAPRDWQWCGKFESQRMFGITEARAKEMAERYGGLASKMLSREDFPSRSMFRRVSIQRTGIVPDCTDTAK